MSDSIAARTEQCMQTLSEMVQRRALVFLGPECLDWESYPEPRMRARVVGAVRYPGYDDGDYVCVKVMLDFAGMDEYNLPFESSNFYDGDGKPTFTARQAGYYTERDTFNVNALDFSKAFTPVSGLSNTLTQMHAESGSDLPYLAWVEKAAALGLGVNPEQEVSLPSHP